jgi:tight adherence protein C
VPITVLVAAVCVATALPLLGWSLVGGGGRSVPAVRENLVRGMELPGDENTPVAAPARSGTLAGMLSTRRTVLRVERLLSRAGRPPAWPLARLLSAKLVLGAVGGTVALLWVLSSPSATHVLLGGGFALVVWAVPDLLLHSRGQERKASITLELPDTLDQMMIAVQAGLGFEAAMARVGANGSGPLAEELTRTLQDIRVGQPRRVAYQALADRTTAPDLRAFIRAVVQADEYGVSVSQVLKVQAAEMRLKRRMRAEEKAMQIPVKVIFPLMLCILPTLFIVLLGPAALQAMRAFSH